MYSQLCTVVADAKQFKATQLTAVSGDCNSYYSFIFDVILNFGLTELTAQLSWEDQTGVKNDPQPKSFMITTSFWVGKRWKRKCRLRIYR